MQAARSDQDHVDPEEREHQAAPAVPAASAGSVDDRISNRVPLERQVEMRFEDFDGFMTECSMNISATGMFIGCDQPQPAGSVLDFTFALDDGDQLIRGYGEVMWARRRADGPERPAGMGIRFLHLDAESRELIRWTVTRRYITGGGPCDVDEVKSAMRRAAERETAERTSRPAAGTTAAEPPRPAGERPARRYREAGYAAAASKPPAARKWRPVAAVAVLVLGGLYLLQVTSTSVGAALSPAIAAAPLEKSPQPSPSIPAAERAAPAPETSPAPTPVAAVEVEAQPAAPETAAEEAVKYWARAWSRQRPDAYLAAYAADFRPPGGKNRGDWEEQRRVKVLRPRWIQLELGAIVTEVENAERARVTFEQAYRSDSYHDVVRKTLVMVHEDAGWKILEERAES